MRRDAIAAAAATVDGALNGLGGDGGGVGIEVLKDTGRRLFFW
jgi:hypothetical protein